MVSSTSDLKLSTIKRVLQNDHNYCFDFGAIIIHAFVIVKYCSLSCISEIRCNEHLKASYTIESELFARYKDNLWTECGNIDSNIDHSTERSECAEFSTRFSFIWTRLHPNYGVISYAIRVHRVRPHQLSFPFALFYSSSFFSFRFSVGLFSFFPCPLFSANLDTFILYFPFSLHLRLFYLHFALSNIRTNSHELPVVPIKSVGIVFKLIRAFAFYLFYLYVRLSSPHRSLDRSSGYIVVH